MCGAVLGGRPYAPMALDAVPGTIKRIDRPKAERELFRIPEDVVVWLCGAACGLVHFLTMHRPRRLQPGLTRVLSQPQAGRKPLAATALV
jgi:hypothetical protein